MNVLAPISWIHGRVVALRRAAVAAGHLTPHGVGVPLLSVGALSAGGSGKTPVTRLLAQRLLDHGLRVGVVHGGYGGRGRRHVARVAPDGDPRIHGDEPLMLARWLPGAVVTCGQDKVAAAALARAHGAQVILLDDGFQHLRLARDLELVLLPPPPVALEATLLRDAPKAAALADLTWAHARDGSLPDPRRSMVGSRYQPLALVRADGTRRGAAADLRGLRVHVLAGVARPRDLLALVRSLGARVVGQTLTLDHRPFSPAQLRRAAQARADLLLCTEKDAARMTGQPWAGDLVALTCAVQVTHGDQLLERALARLARQCVA